MGAHVHVIVPQLVAEGGAAANFHLDSVVFMGGPGVVFGSSGRGGRLKGEDEDWAPDAQECGHVEIVIDIAEFDNRRGSDGVGAFGAVGIDRPVVRVPDVRAGGVVDGARLDDVEVQAMLAAEGGERVRARVAGATAKRVGVARGHVRARNVESS